MYKAKQRMKTLLLACFAALVSMFLAVALWVTPTSKIDASAADITYSYTFSKTQFSANETKQLGGVDWTLAGEGGYLGYDGTKGQQFGSGNNPYKSLTLTSASFSNVSEIIINTSGASSVKATLTVSVGGTSVGTYTLTDTATEKTFSVDNLSGAVVFSYTQTSSKAIYIKSITINYTEPDTPECEHSDKTLTEAKEATCTKDGNIAYWTCNNSDCKKIFKDSNCTEVTTLNNTVLKATGHNYVGGVCSVCGEAQPTEATLTFDADKANRTEYSTEKQVWGQNGIMFINNKGASTTNIADYGAPVRLYANSEIVIEYPSMTKISFTCNNTTYATALKNSIGTPEDATATVNGTVVTVEFAAPKDSFTVAKLSAQVRMDSITVHVSTCEHTNTTEITNAPTCTETGSTTVTCDDCGETISTEEKPATGHNLNEGEITQAPQIGIEGIKTYTCQNEGCSYTETEIIPALDATRYTVSYSVPVGVEAPANVELANGESVTLEAVSAPAGFTFVGWVEEAYKESNVAPETIYTANSEYTLIVENNITLYALYSYSAGSGNFVKVTETPANWSGKYLIVAEGEDGAAYVFNAQDAVNGYVKATIDNSAITFSEELEAEMVTIAAMDGDYSILTKNGYIYGKANGNALSFNESTAQLNTIVLADDCSVTITSGRVLRFNSASNQMRFRYYTSGTQDAVYLYTLDRATYYLTDCSANIDSASITIGKDITMNYYVTMPDAFAGAKMHFTVDDKTYEADGIKGEDGRYVFSLDIPPHFMANNISATLIYNENTLASKAVYSVKEYAQNMLNDAESSDKLKQLVTDLLYYGAAAQKYKDYNTENLATDGVENLGTPFAVAPTNTDFTLEKNTEISEYPAYFQGAGVYFDNVNKIYVKLNTTENVTLKINGVNVDVNSTTVYTNGILATQFGETYTFVLSYDGTVMQTLEYSVNAYAYAKKDDAEMGELALALYRYGVSAKEYAGA
ncbi:MAG: hypothetical protein E7364_03770 [Clostridiales bacterium]|nr:hypothetical protein [Clostridiales bacterium]